MTHKRPAAVTFGAAVAVALLAATTCKAPRGDVRLGFAGALSGSASFVGTEIKRGAEIAIDEINATGGVDGRRLLLVARDDEHTPKNTMALYRELVERQNVVGMIGATNSASMLAVVPLVNESLRVPVICPATDATAITENDAKKEGRDNYLFRVGMYGTGQANVMVDSVVVKFGHRRVGLLTWTGGWGVTGRQELRRRLKEHGLEPVADETYDDSDTDMTPQILKLKAAGAESILNYGLVRENAFVVKTKRQLKDATPYVSAWGLSGPAFVKAAEDATEGVFVTTTATIDGPQPTERQRFVTEYQARYGQTMIAPVYALGAYDAVHLFKTAMQRAGLAPSSIRKALEEIPSFDGLVVKCARPVFTHDRHNALTEEDMLLTRWTQGKQLRVEFDAKGPYVQLGTSSRRYLDPRTMQLLPN